MRGIRKLSFKVVFAAIFIVLLTSVIPIQAVEYNVGVKVGDWMKYGKFHASVTGAMTGLSEIAEMNDIDWAKMEVKGVSGTEVTIENTGEYRNGTPLETETSEVDVATGSGSAFFLVLLIGADLKEGDIIMPQAQVGGLSITINGTATRTYCKAMRSVNYVDISTSIMGQSITAKWYWDKATGIMVETFTNMSMTAPIAVSFEVSLKAVETNMWSADVLGTMSTYFIYIVGIVVLVVVIVAGVFILRRRKPAPTMTPTPTVTEGKSE